MLHQPVSGPSQSPTGNDLADADILNRLVPCRRDSERHDGSFWYVWEEVGVGEITHSREEEGCAGEDRGRKWVMQLEYGQRRVGQWEGQEVHCGTASAHRSLSRRDLRRGKGSTDTSV